MRDHARGPGRCRVADARRVVRHGTGRDAGVLKRPEREVIFRLGPGDAVAIMLGANTEITPERRDRSEPIRVISMKQPEAPEAETPELIRRALKLLMPKG